MKTTTISNKSRIIFLACLFVVGLISCQKVEFPDPSTLPQGLIGTWIETNTLTDTLMFSSNELTGLCTLHRGYEIRNGYRLPIIGSTGYHYEITGDSIQLIDGLSSTFARESYYFYFDEPNLTIRIGKFSKYIDTKRSILTFRKIK